jgi:hypothetical protein
MGVSHSIERFAPKEHQYDVFGGIRFARLGDLARECGLTRWRTSPLGKGDGAAQLLLFLGDLSLYAHDSNKATRGDGNLMGETVLRYLKADDDVVVMDTGYVIAKSIADGTANFTEEPVASDSLNLFGGDRIRAANRSDVIRIVKRVFRPTSGEAR